MTQPLEQLQEPDMTASAQDPAPSYLMEFILGILSPLLMVGSITDLHLARLAAVEAIDAYTASGNGNGQIMTIGQIVAFAVTALDNLRLSMPAELSLSMKLKLRGNANALNRTARANTHLLQQGQPETSATARQTTTAVQPEPKTTPPRPQPPETAQPASPATSLRHNQDWASALKAQAASLRANAIHVPPAQQQANLLWVEVLNDVASDLTRGMERGQAKSPGQGYPPGTIKSELMRTTVMSSGATFPPHLIDPIRR